MGRFNFLEQNKPTHLMSDSLMTPTFIDDIAYAMKHLFLNFYPSIFHIVGADSMSSYEAGIIISKTFNLDQKLILKTTYRKYSKNKAFRPQYSQIKSKKNNFYKMKTFKQGLEIIKSQI